MSFCRHSRRTKSRPCLKVPLWGGTFFEDWCGMSNQDHHSGMVLATCFFGHWRFPTSFLPFAEAARQPGWLPQGSSVAREPARRPARSVRQSGRQPATPTAWQLDSQSGRQPTGQSSFRLFAQSTGYCPRFRLWPNACARAQWLCQLAVSHYTPNAPWSLTICCGLPFLVRVGVGHANEAALPASGSLF